MKSTKSVKVLFICTANMDRSPTAERLLKTREGFEVCSAGMWKHAVRQVSRELIDWADKILVMEDYHKEAILNLNSEVTTKIDVLGIPDIYEKNQPELLEILKRKLSRVLKINW